MMKLLQELMICLNINQNRANKMGEDDALITVGVITTIIIFIIILLADMIYANTYLNRIENSDLNFSEQALARIIIINQPQKEFCGWTFLSGKVIILNTAYQPNDCGFNNWTEIIQHEEAHAYYFQKPRGWQLAYCRERNMGWSRECWEEYANEKA